MGKRRSDARKAQHTPDDAPGYRHEVIGSPDCRYLERWTYGVGVGRAWFTLRLHHFFRSDEDHLHDHPFWFVTLVLKGSYEDVVECRACLGRGELNCERWVTIAPGDRVSLQGCTMCGVCSGKGQIVGDRMTPGKIRFRPALHKHRVVTDGCWTLVLSGPKMRDWGFTTPKGWLRQRAYFKEYGGSAACVDHDA